MENKNVKDSCFVQSQSFLHYCVIDVFANTDLSANGVVPSTVCILCFDLSTVLQVTPITSHFVN